MVDGEGVFGGVEAMVDIVLVPTTTVVVVACDKDGNG